MSRIKNGILFLVIFQNSLHAVPRLVVLGLQREKSLRELSMFLTLGADGSWDHLRRALVLRLKRKGRLGLSEGFIDGSFIRAKKGGPVWKYQAASEGKRALF